MKKILLFLFALSIIQVYAQDLSSIKNTATTSSSSMIEKLAADQVKSLTKKLNLSETQQAQVSDLVIGQLKSDKFQKLIGSMGSDKLLSANSSNTEKLQNALIADKDFQKDLKSVLDEEQTKKLNESIKY